MAEIELTDQEIREGFEALRWFEQNSSKFFEAVLWPKGIKSEVEK